MLGSVVWLALDSRIVEVYSLAPFLSSKGTFADMKQVCLWILKTCSFVSLTLWWEELLLGPKLNTCGADLSPAVRSQAWQDLRLDSWAQPRWVSALQILTHLILTVTLWIMCVLLFRWGNRHGEVKQFAQGHIASKWSHSRESNSTGLAPKSTVKYTLILSILIQSITFFFKKIDGRSPLNSFHDPMILKTSSKELFCESKT